MYIYLDISVNFFPNNFSTADSSACFANCEPDLFGQSPPNQFKTVYITYQWDEMANLDCMIDLRGYRYRYMSIYIYNPRLHLVPL